MLMNDLCDNNKYGFDNDQLYGLLLRQFGEKAKYIIDARRGGRLPFEVEFWITCQHNALRISDEVWTHSLFAALKLALENDGGLTPRFIVSGHPVVTTAQHIDEIPVQFRKESDVIRFGMMGWVSRSKRIIPIVRAFAMALQTMSHEQRVGPNWL